MADNKNYYYLKLKENFYDSEEMLILQNMQDGYLYSDILMKLYLRSLKSNGRLMFNNAIPYTPEILAQVVRHQVGTVKQALHIFQTLGLIEILDNGAIFMLNIQNFIGESSTEADRKRLYRMQISEEKKELGQMSGQTGDKNPPEIKYNRDIIKYNNNTPSNSFDEVFEKLWTIYPKKQGKKDAKRHFISAMKKGVSVEVIENGLTNYLDYIEKNHVSMKYVKQGSTWFNQESWNDDYSIDVEEQKGKSKVEQNRELLERLRNNG